MKKILIMILCSATLFLCVSCSSTGLNTSDTVSESASIVSDNISTVDSKPCLHIYKEEIYKEPNYGVNGIKIKYCTLCGDTEHVAVPALPEIFEITVKNKTVFDRDDKSYVLFDIEIKNTSDKTIKSISGTLSVLPPNCILELICDFEDLSLQPYSTTTVSTGGYSFDSTSSDTVEKKVYDADFENIRFSFSPTDVVVEE